MPTELYASGKVNFSSPIDLILVRPRISAQVYVDGPDKFKPRGVDRDYWHETWGMLSLHERHIHITPSVSVRSSHIVRPHSQVHTIIESRATDFDVFRLIVPRPLDVKTPLLHLMRPKREGRHGAACAPGRVSTDSPFGVPKGVPACVRGGVCVGGRAGTAWWTCDQARTRRMVRAPSNVWH